MKLQFELMVDSGNKDEPDPRRFGSLDAALAAFEQLDPYWQRFAWIREDGDTSVIVHMRDGVRA